MLPASTMVIGKLRQSHVHEIPRLGHMLKKTLIALMQRENTEFLKKKQGKLCNPNTTSRDLVLIYSI